jgi:probable HAF family extracellular repeat protein
MKTLLKREGLPLVSLVVLALLFGTVSAARALSFTFTTIDVPGATITEAQGINNLGQIVGFFRTSASRANHGFLLSRGTFTTIDVPGATDTIANGINDRGQIVGEFDANGKIHGFLLSGEDFTIIDAPGAASTIANGINDGGQIVGHFLPANSFNAHGFLLSRGTFTTIDAPGAASTAATGINDRGRVLLDSTTGNFLFSQGNFFLLPPVPGATFGTDAFGLNDLVQIVGFFAKPNDPILDHGFLLRINHFPPTQEFHFTTIDVPGATDTEPNGINDGGQIVGNFTDASDMTHGFLAVCHLRAEEACSGPAGGNVR